MGFKVTQTYTNGRRAGQENLPASPVVFDTLEEAGAYISKEKAWDVENGSSPIEYRLYEEIPAQYVERKYKLGIVIID